MHATKQHIRYRLTFAQLFSPALLGVPILGVESAAFWIDSPVTLPQDLPVLMQLTVILAVSYAAFACRFGVTLDCDGLIAHGHRSCKIPWSDIELIYMKSSGWMKVLVVRERSGRKTLLRAPIPFLDAQFERKSAEIFRIYEDRIRA
ncbi:hypothetical protein ACFFHJ_17395 [Planotetraspora thailandica]|uniref:hypothetical protein n=1 Tax=Planotetraspora thailandica TaxID=487172 RepID=UPI001950C78B|nr:hypothetical protein [Planotetraspora thailandica]